MDDTADSLHWMVHKSNASRAGFGFGIQRVLDEERGRLTFTAVDLPDAARPKQAEALPVILNLLRNEEGRNVRKKELVERVRGVIDVSERTVRSVLESDKFQAHPNVERMQLAGRGSPVAFRWVDVTAGERCSSG